MDKAPDAFRTISEVGDDLDIPQHVLRFWETRFSQIKPMKRSGGRRYYRPDDVDLLRGIRRLLYGEGYTIRGVQRILKEQGIKAVQALSDTARPVPSLYAMDDGAPARPPRRHDDPLDEPAEEEVVADDIAAIAPEPIAPPPRRALATPLPRVDVPPRPPESSGHYPPAVAATAQALPKPSPLDVSRLKTVLHDLIACRQLLDAAMKEG